MYPASRALRPRLLGRLSICDNKQPIAFIKLLFGASHLFAGLSLFSANKNRN